MLVCPKCQVLFFKLSTSASNHFALSVRVSLVATALHFQQRSLSSMCASFSSAVTLYHQSHAPSPVSPSATASLLSASQSAMYSAASASVKPYAFSAPHAAQFHQ